MAHEHALPTRSPPDLPNPTSEGPRRAGNRITTRDASPEATRRKTLILAAVDQMDRSSPRRRIRIANRIAALPAGGSLHSLTRSTSSALLIDDEQMADDAQDCGADYGDLEDDDLMEVDDD